MFAEIEEYLLTFKKPYLEALAIRKGLCLGHQQGKGTWWEHSA
jgi:hypothetical protein